MNSSGAEHAEKKPDSRGSTKQFFNGDFPLSSRFQRKEERKEKKRMEIGFREIPLVVLAVCALAGIAMLIRKTVR